MKSLIRKLKILRWRIKSLWAVYKYGNPSKKLKVVGVTGTNGKTTTVTLLYKLATALGYKAGLVSTVENIILNEKIPADMTTPDSVALTKLFAKMLERGCEYVFMEVSSHALDQNRVLFVNFTGGVFTNLTHDHLDYHKNFTQYFNAKKKLFSQLESDAFALSNTDDERGASMLLDIKARKFSYGFTGGENFHGELVKKDFSGLLLKFNQTEVRSGLLGRFNAYNLLSAWSACQLLGFDMEKVVRALVDIEPPRGRFEHFTSPGGVLVVVDYAHSPDSLEKILLAVKEIQNADGKMISVFGCGGDRDPIKRKIMGKIGATLSDIAIFTSDNPRSEDPDKIIAQMKIDLSSIDLEKVMTIPNRREAILEAVKIAHRGDIILCAGKGHENYQEIKGVKHHFDDMEELKGAFAQT